MSSGFRIPAIRFHPLSLWQDDNPAKPSPSATGQMARWPQMAVMAKLAYRGPGLQPPSTIGRDQDDTD